MRDAFNFRLYDAVVATGLRRRERRTSGAFSLHAACVEAWQALAGGGFPTAQEVTEHRVATAMRRAARAAELLRLMGYDNGAA